MHFDYSSNKNAPIHERFEKRYSNKKHVEMV
jgi:hypothetical protein